MKTNPTTTIRKGLILALMASAMSVTGISRAQDINVNFERFTPSTGTPEVESTLVGPAGGLGTEWNQLQDEDSAGPLEDSTGTVTTVEFTTNFTEGRAGGGGNTPMLRSTLTDFGRVQSRTLTITGLTASALYDLWLTSYRDSTAARERTAGKWTMVNATTSASAQDIDNRSGRNGTTFVYGYNYILFENVEADGTGQIVVDGKGFGTVDGYDDDYRLGLSGFQLKPASPAGPADAALSTVEASPTVVDADGTSTSAITVTLKDATGKVAAGKDVTLAGNPGNAAITPATPVTTDASGVATFAVSSSSANVEVFTATVVTDSVVVTQTASVEFVPVGVVDPDVSTVAAAPGSALADGVATSTVTVTLATTAGSPVAGKDVTLAGDGAGTISPGGAQTTNASGQVSFTVSSTTAGTEVFTATNTTDSQVITQTASVDFLPVAVDPNVSTVVASPTSVPADGLTESTITVTLKDVDGFPFAGKDVSLAGDGFANILPSTPQTTDVNGEAIFTVASTAPGVEVFTATNDTDSQTITQTASVDFLGVGAVDAGTSTVEASPVAAAADGVSSSTITVTLRDINSLLVENEDVTLAGSPGNAVITPSSATTDANGVATFTVTSSTIGSEVFTATVTTSGNLVITQTASVDFLDPDTPLVINVNFEQFTPSTTTPEVESTLEGPAGGLGTEWNQFADEDSAGPLVDSNGLVTSVEFTTNFTEGRSGGGGNTPMFRSTLTDFGRGAQRTLTITGLDGGGFYNIWLTSYRDSTAARERTVGTWTTTNSTTSPASQIIDNRAGRNGTTFVDGYNFVLFENVQATGSGQIVFDGEGATVAGGFDDDYRLGLSGLQIVETSVSFIGLAIAPNATNPGNYDFTITNTVEGKVYDLLSNPDLSTAPDSWPVWMGNENIPGTALQTIVPNVPGGSDPIRFFAVIEKDLLTEDFEGGAIPTGWTASAAVNGTQWEVDDPSTGGFASGPPAAASGSNCAGTNVTTNGGQYTSSVDVKLTSPSLAIPAGSGATLNFQQFIDTDFAGDTGSVRILDAGTGLLIGTLETLNIEGDGTGASWSAGTEIVMDAVDVGGKSIKVEFQFVSDASGEFGGFYIDDVVVAVTAP